MEQQKQQETITLQELMDQINGTTVSDENKPKPEQKDTVIGIDVDHTNLFGS